MKANTFFS